MNSIVAHITSTTTPLLLVATHPSLFCSTLTEIEGTERKREL